jgi:hypothetical protein
MTIETVAQPRSHRKAFGPQRKMSPTIKARNIAQSIALRLVDGRAWAWEDYGVADKPDMIALVETALAQL